jgi:FkbM family methyltransferase
MNRNLPTFSAAEERNKLSHFTVQGFDLKGIMHGGANDGEEMENAIRLGVEHLIAFEPLTSAFELLHGRYGDKVHCYKIGLHNTDQEKDLFITDGDGKGSTLMNVNYGHPEVVKNWNDGQAMFIGKEVITVRRFDTWAMQHPEIDLSLYDTLQLDTQGNEFEILEGMGELLQGFKFLCLELSTIPAYEGEVVAEEVSAWLEQRGFIQDSPLYTHNDAFFIRKDIKAVSDRIYLGRC